MELLQGDCLEVLRRLPDNSIDSLITDPPAGISFMGKEWDEDKGGRKEWIRWMSEVMAEAMRTLKPGAHGLVWAIPRTSHWTATALEDAGFEIRDVITHIFGSGFPKSLDISKAIDKAAGAEREVIGKYVHLNHAERGDSNISEQVQSASGAPFNSNAFEKHQRLITAPSTHEAKQWQGWGTALKPASEHWILVRKPISEKTVAANVLKHGTGGLNIDASRIGTTENLNGGAYSKGREARAMSVTGEYPNGTKPNVKNIGEYTQPAGRFPANLVLSEPANSVLDTQAGAEVSRFFYCAKASKSDKGSENNHPTVKSTNLMSYLIKLITPPNGIVLDPFMGSGSTGVAAVREGFQFIGIEREHEYLEIARKRIGA